MSQLNRRLLCLDAESVTDPELLSDNQTDSFPAPQRHHVVAISFLEARIERAPGGERYIVEQCRSGGTARHSEERLLKGFWTFFADSTPRLVTWNGKGFVMPVLRQRAMVHGLPAAAWFQAGDKWNNYGQRYAPDWHCDLMEVFSDYGAAPRVGLEALAEAIGLPGKTEGHGAEVADLVMRGDIAAVRRYCETDVLNIFALYVRWALLSGRTDAEGHNASIDSLVAYVERERGDRPHLGAFLDRWRESTRPAPMFVPVPSGPADCPPEAQGRPETEPLRVLEAAMAGRDGAEAGLRAAARDLSRHALAPAEPTPEPPTPPAQPNGGGRA